MWSGSRGTSGPMRRTRSAVWAMRRIGRPDFLIRSLRGEFAMVKTTLTATVFVSSPGDVQQERDSVQTTVAKWNSRNSAARGVTFRVWAWEENSVPDLGNDAQDVMNTQVPIDYDVLVGIFWSRLGTPTGRFGSGSQEEIEAAIERRVKTGFPHVALYFKKDNFPIDKIDISQLERLREFEKDIKSRALVNHFNEIQAFESQIERLLDKKADEFREGAPPAKLNILQTAAALAYASGQEKYADYGLLDLVEEGVEALSKSTSIMTAIGNEISLFGEKIEGISERLRNAQAYGEVSIKRTRPIVKEAANEMNELSSYIDERIDDFSEHFHKAAELSMMVLDISGDFDDSDGHMAEYKKSLDEMKTGGQAAIVSQQNMRNTIASLPRLDMQTNQAKRRLSGVIDRLIDVMQAGFDRLSDV